MTLHASTTTSKPHSRNRLHALHSETTHLSNPISNRTYTPSSTSSRYISTLCVILIVFLATAKSESGQDERTEN